MKTTRFLAILAAVILGFVACEKKDNTQNIESDVIKEQAYADLFQQLDAYNSTFEFDSSNGYMQKKGGFWDWLKRVVGADASGALIGGLVASQFNMTVFGAVVGAAVNSLGAVLSNPYKELTEADITNARTYQIMNNEVGVLHNQIIKDIFAEHPNLSNDNTSTDEVISLVKEQIEKRGLATKKELNDFCENEKFLIGTREIIKSETPNEIANKMVSLYPEIASEIQVVNNYTLHVENINTIDKKIEYTEGVLDIVDKSAIPLKSKELITSASNVYINSSVLWSE